MTSSLPLAILDFVHLTEGQSPHDALLDTVRVAQDAERLGFHRYWVPEHHNSSGLGFTSTEVLVAHLAAATQRIRVGAAGIMLPNHSALKVAEVFRTLEALHPGRIDLGLGRAPGTDGVTAFALRGRDPSSAGAEFPDLAALLLAFLDDAFPADHPYAQVIAAPLVSTRPEVFVLGSSAYGPRFSAVNGLATAFAHHMSPEFAVEGLTSYRRDFTPGYAVTPHSTVSVLVHATDDPAEADLARASWAMFIDRIRSGRRGPGPGLNQVAAYAQSARFGPATQGIDDRMFVGPADEVAARVATLAAAAEVDEVALISPLTEWGLRTRSLKAFADAWHGTPAVTAAASPPQRNRVAPAGR